MSDLLSHYNPYHTRFVNIPEPLRSQLAQPLYVKRIAVRPYNGARWEWFGNTVTFSLLTNYYAIRVLEAQCVEAVKLYDMSNCKIVQGPSQEALDMADLNEDTQG